MSKEEMKQAALRLLEENILPYWMWKMEDRERGGFYGRRDGHDVLYKDAPRGAILNARILWAFSAAYRVLGKPEYLATATRARDYLMEHFIDREYGGVYWSVDADGHPLDTKKQTYAQGFAIYGFSEYARATGDKAALETAKALFEAVEAHCYDRENGGYHEALTRDWQPMADMRLSDKDENGDKTMNTHLHILEPYTNLYRVWPDKRLGQRLVELLHVFTDKLMNSQTHHLDLFFDEQWHGKRNIESYGHDIEASWLMTETLQVLGDKVLGDRVLPYILRIAKASEEGLQPDGSMINERRIEERMERIEERGMAQVRQDGNHKAQTSILNPQSDRDWWVQCECVIGEINLAQLNSQTSKLNSQASMSKASRCLQYIVDNLVDWEYGEWYWGIRPDGSPNLDDDHAGFWKCPYHNTRMCLEILERLK